MIMVDNPELTETADNKWKTLSSENGPGPRTGAASALVTDRLFIFGGFDIEKGESHSPSIPTIFSYSLSLVERCTCLRHQNG
jgi:N-acetylneuraminic acid mutarotase